MCKHNIKSLPKSRWLNVSSWLLILFCCAATALDSSAADGASNSKAKRKSAPTVGDRPEIIGSTTTTSTKPARPSQTGVNPETAQLVAKFQSARTDYLAAQKEQKLVKTTELTEEQRALLREKSKEALARWREDQRRYAEEQQERIQSIKADLQSDLAQRVDSVKEETGGRGR